MNEGMENLKQIAELEEKCMKYISYIKKLDYKENKKYTAEEIREAVDIATGDDGFRGKEVISILETNVSKKNRWILERKDNKKWQLKNNFSQ